MTNDCRGTSARREVRPSPRLMFLYRIYLFIIVWLVVLPLLVSIVILTTQAVSLFFSVPALILVLIALYWIPKFHASILYTFTEKEIISKRGVWIRQTSMVLYNRIKSVEIIKGRISRSLGLSDLRVRMEGSITPGESSEEFLIRGIQDPDELRERIMERVKACAELADRQSFGTS